MVYKYPSLEQSIHIHAHPVASQRTMRSKLLAFGPGSVVAPLVGTSRQHGWVAVGCQTNLDNGGRITHWPPSSSYGQALGL